MSTEEINFNFKGTKSIGFLVGILWGLTDIALFSSQKGIGTNNQIKANNYLVEKSENAQMQKYKSGEHLRPVL